MRFSIIVAFAAGVAVAVPGPAQIILNPKNNANRSPTHVSKDHESVNKAPPAVVYAIRNPEDGSVTGWKCRESSLHGAELRRTKEELPTKSYKEFILEHYKSILICCLLWSIFLFIVEMMIRTEAKALAQDIEMARLEDNVLFDYEMQSQEVVLFQYED